MNKKLSLIFLLSFALFISPASAENIPYNGAVCYQLLEKVHEKARSIKSSKDLILENYKDDKKARKNNKTALRIELQQSSDRLRIQIDNDYLYMASVVTIYEASKCGSGPLIKKLECLATIDACE